MTKKDYNLLAKLIQVNSWTKNIQGVNLSQKIFEEYLKPLEMKTKIFKQNEIGDIYFYTSEKKEGKKLLLLGHMDTVFPQGDFEEYKEDDEWIYGPGVCDMKGGLFVAYMALKKIKDEFNKIYNIDFLIVSDEETGSDISKSLTSKIAKEYDYCLVYEAAGKNLEIVNARKGVGTFFIDITGKAAHAGNHYSDGADANLEASIKLQKLVSLTNLDKGTTVNVGKIEGGIGANTISPQAKLTFEIRYTKSSEKNRLLKEIEKIVNTSYVKGTNSTLSGSIQRDVMEPTTTQEDFINQIKKLTNIDLKTEARGGVSDANIVASSGTIVLDGLGPFGDGDHTIKERALKKSFDERIDLSYKIFKAIEENRFL